MQSVFVTNEMQMEPEFNTGSARMREVWIPPLGLPGTLHVPRGAYALVIFVHGSGSSRLSPRNTNVAEALNRHGLATLLFDLLSPAEEDMDNRARVFDIPLLAHRLIDAIHFVDHEPSLAQLPIGLFGASTGAAAKIVKKGEPVKRSVSAYTSGPKLGQSNLEPGTSFTL